MIQINVTPFSTKLPTVRYLITLTAYLTFLTIAIRNVFDLAAPYLFRTRAPAMPKEPPVMSKLTPLDAAFLAAETQATPAHVAMLQIFQLPPGKGSAWLAA